MYFGETDSPFSFARFAPALAAANDAVPERRINDLLVQRLWSEKYYKPCPRKSPEGTMPHAMVRPPSPEAIALAHQPQPITRRDILLGLFREDGLPRDPAVHRVAASMASGHPSAAAETAAFYSLGSVAWCDYPEQGQRLIGRIILPYRRLLEFCGENDLREPETLIRRLAATLATEGVEGPQKGRPPKHVDVYMVLFRERAGTGAVLANPIDEARWLWHWMRDRLEAKDLPQVETIRNRLINVYDFSSRQMK